MDGYEVSLWDMVKREVIGAGIVEGGFSVIGTYLRQLLLLFGLVSLFTPAKYLSYIVTVSSIIVTLFEIVTEVKEEQPENALFPTVMTLSGMVMEVKEEQESNVAPSIIFTLDGMVTEVNDVAWKKAPSPI